MDRVGGRDGRLLTVTCTGDVQETRAFHIGRALSPYEDFMHEWTEQAQQEAEDKVFRMAANDPTFRALALSDGRAAVEKATGRKLPEGFNTRFVDPSGAHLTAVLPRAAYEAQDYIRAIEQLTMTTLRNIIGGLDLEVDLHLAFCTRGLRREQAKDEEQEK